MIKAVIFDFDGVIHDTLEIVYKLNKQRDPSLSLEEYKSYFDGNFYKKRELTKEGIDDFFKLQEKEFEELIIEENIKKHLIKLRNKFELFIISSNSEQTLKDYLKRNNLINTFTKIYGFETHTSKEEKFKLLMNKFNLKKEEIIFVTDTLGDILEANKIGVKTIAVDFGFHEKERLEKGKPYKIISDLDEIQEIINKI